MTYRVLRRQFIEGPETYVRVPPLSEIPEDHRPVDGDSASVDPFAYFDYLRAGLHDGTRRGEVRLVNALADTVARAWAKGFYGKPHRVRGR